MNGNAKRLVHKGIGGSAAHLLLDRRCVDQIDCVYSMNILNAFNCVQTATIVIMSYFISKYYVNIMNYNEIKLIKIPGFHLTLLLMAKL